MGDKMKNYHDYLYTKQLNLNLVDIRKSVEILYGIIMQNFGHLEGAHRDKHLQTTSRYNYYNCFMYPTPGIYEIYKEVQNLYRDVEKNKEPAFIQCWLNIFWKGDFIDWHGHSNPGLGIWHGLYCVNTEDSHTSYRIKDLGLEFDVPSQDNLLVLGKSEGDEHRSSEWQKESPRITIAFDIVPARNISPFNEVNHWVPI